MLHTLKRLEFARTFRAEQKNCRDFLKNRLILFAAKLFGLSHALIVTPEGQV